MPASIAGFDVRRPRVDSRRTVRGTSETALTSLEQARRIAALAQEKLATDVRILDMRAVCDYTDYFVVATGRTARQTKAIHDAVVQELKHSTRTVPRSTGGLPEATWIVDDFLDVVLHVFTPETREYYAIEDLWSDVPTLDAVATG